MFGSMSVCEARPSGDWGSLFICVLIHLLGERSTPNLFSRLQTLSSNLLFRRALVSNDPRNSELCLLMVILNLDSVSDFYLTSATAKLHAMVADI